MFSICLFRPLLGHIFFLAWSSPFYKNKNALLRTSLTRYHLISPPYSDALNIVNADLRND